MRDYLKDAEGAAQRGDVGPGKANRDRDKPVFPKRFYARADVAEYDDGFGIRLDDKELKTPGKQTLLLPTSNAAELLAEEWNAIEGEINPLLMPVTRLANTAFDGVAHEMDAVSEDIIRYAGSDLLCYRADGPQGLVELQNKHWDPVLDWASQTMGAHFEIGSGIMHVAQPRAAMTAFASALRKHRDPFRLTCLHSWTSLSGSALLALALAEAQLVPNEAWQAAHVDEDWNIAQWGEDYEAAERRKQRRKDFEAAFQLFAALG